ncbi:MAG TPA: lysophospholipid acyltransferase family protein [Steroidobacteraceae bacterium]
MSCGKDLIRIVVAEPEIIARAAAAEAKGLRSDAFYWRFVATALSFAVFGCSALLLSLTVLPLLRLLPRERCQRYSRIVLQRGMRAFIGVMYGLGTLTYEFQGTQRLGRAGQLIVANHPSLIDVIFLIAFTPQADCIVKQAMFRNLLTRSVVRGAGYIGNGQAVDMIEGAAATLRSGQCLIMFPEGTRTRPGQPLTLHRGAANVAVRAASIVTPVYIRCVPTTLTKSEPWYRIPLRRPHFSLQVGEDFELGAFHDMASIPVASRAFNECLRARFEGELQRLNGYTPGQPAVARPA